jgi:hypothetical protein
MSGVTLLKTIPVIVEAEGTYYFPRRDAQKILGIRHHHTFNAHLKVLGLTEKPITWTEIKEILALKLFLYARLGYHTRAMYQTLRKKGQLPLIFSYYAIDLENEFRSIKDEYYKRQTQERQGTNPTCG